MSGLGTAGVIGLGLIGTALARRLLAAGYTVYGYDVRAERSDNLALLGGKACASAAALARQCSTVVLSVFNTDQVEDVVEGQGSAGFDPRHTLICTSTCDPDRIQALARRAAQRGVRFVEAPLSGNSDQIAKGNGVALVGGTRYDMAAAQPVLDALCRQSFYLGPAGSGGRAKLAVNLVGGLNRAVMAEGLAFAESMGLELKAFLEVMKGSAVYSRAMDTRGMKMVDSDFTPHAWLAQSLKDFTLMHEVAARVGQELPLATIYTEIVQSCIAHGEGQLDNSVVIQELRRRRKPK
ncbi:MAG: NAD(P)-dependent oxidoreductase [Betaproteobacteria bacterium]|nr:NAD(P)-dependent oxidoreductase [Betaproteobacteria bacterium]